MAVLRSLGIGSVAVAILLGVVATRSEHAEASPVSGVVINGAADTSVLSSAVRLDPPEPPPTATPLETPLANTSNCRTDLSGAVATVTIVSISYVCPIYAGGQSTIDAGAATWVTDAPPSSVWATHAGGSGTLWLAGHRTSHGGAFADIPDLADGAVITVADATGTASYRVVGRAYVRVRNGLVVDHSGATANAATASAVLRADFGGDGAPRLVLQTCDGADLRWMIYADLLAA